MDMIKVYLVEDEFVIREGIRKNIDWTANGLELCGDASDGELAWTEIREKKPDTKVVVGGAVMTQEYADPIGADAYSKDAMQTVRYCDEVFGV